MSYFLGWAWVPLFSGLVFMGGLIAMLALWANEGHPQYQPNEGTIVYISDVGAHLKPLFICTSPICLTYNSDLRNYCSNICSQSGY